MFHFRYAFKLMYDEAVLGEVSSHEEFNEYLTEYDNDWYMGQDTDEDWNIAVINDKPNLFALGRNKDDVSLICCAFHVPFYIHSHP